MDVTFGQLLFNSECTTDRVKLYQIRLAHSCFNTYTKIAEIDLEITPVKSYCFELIVHLLSGCACYEYHYLPYVQYKFSFSKQIYNTLWTSVCLSADCTHMARWKICWKIRRACINILRDSMQDSGVITAYMYSYTMSLVITHFWVQLGQ